MHPRGQGAEPGLRAPLPNEHPRRERGRCQSGWRARCRALALALLCPGLGVATGLGSAGCGPLLFEPSAFTPQKVELIYSVQEDITLVRWRITSTKAADPDLSFDILEENGTYEPIDFSKSVFPGGGAPCADGVGTCFQVARPRLYTAPAPVGTVRAVHAVQGFLPGGRTTAQTVQTTLGLASFFHTGNDVVYLNITDLVAQDGPYVFPRSYQQAMWPTNGLCVSGSPPDNVGFSPVDATFSFPPPKPLTDEGTYCVGIQPVRADTAEPALVQTRVAALPEVAPVKLTYTPPVEYSPIIYQIVLDLEIIPERCDSSIQTIEALVRQAMNLAGVPVQQLKTLNLADPTGAGGGSPCAQPQSPSFDGDAMAEEIKQTASMFPQMYQQVHFLYFNNLNVLLPPTLTSSLTTLFNDLMTGPPNQYLQTLSWLFNPGLANGTHPSWWKSTTWQSAIDPAGNPDPDFKKALIEYAQDNLPYTSQIHDPTVPIAFFTPDQVAAYGGGRFKICNSSSAVQVVDTTHRSPLGGGPSWPIQANDPPGFLAYLPTPVNAPGPSFVPVGVSADLQVCTKYCTDHPYLTIGGRGVLSWSTSDLCETSQ
jgi:hypothetical protein